MGDGSEYGARLDGLERVWGGWARLGSGLDEVQWSRPTRCPGWDVAAVFAHASLFPVALAEMPLDGAAAVGADAGRTAVNVLRGFNEPGGVAHAMAGAVADAAVQDARGHSREELVARFGGAGDRAVQRLRATGPATLVPWPGSGAIALVEGLRIVVMESVVHLLDALRALELPAEVPEAALRDTVRLLAELAPAVEFVEAATGRADRLPLPLLR